MRRTEEEIRHSLRKAGSPCVVARAIPRRENTMPPTARSTRRLSSALRLSPRRQRFCKGLTSERAYTGACSPAAHFQAACQASGGEEGVPRRATGLHLDPVPPADYALLLCPLCVMVYMTRYTMRAAERTRARWRYARAGARPCVRLCVGTCVTRVQTVRDRGTCTRASNA